MEFKITRTSDHDDEKPCKGAFKKDYVYSDCRTVARPEDIRRYKNRPDEARDMWYGDGTNHRKIGKTQIARDFVTTGWFITLDSLDDLIALAEREGHLIIGLSANSSEIMEIEIYDSYRE